MAQRLRLGFLASHTGSSLREIVRAIEAAELDASVEIVISNNADAPALEFARSKGIPTAHISAKTAGSPEAADRAIAHQLRASNVGLVVLSGYLRKVGPSTLRAFPGHILNIHPSLLPKFGGRGMFGAAVHEAVIAAKERYSGATVHIVDEEYDHGTVIARFSIEISPGETVESLKSKIMELEPGLFIYALKQIAQRGHVFPLLSDIMRAPLRVWNPPGFDGMARWASDLTTQFRAGGRRIWDGRRKWLGDLAGQFHMPHHTPSSRHFR